MVTLLFSFSFSAYFQNTIVEASIQLPPSLFSLKQKRDIRPADDSVYKLQLIAFRNGKLFPATGNSTNLADDGKRRTVVTPVILTKIGAYVAYTILYPLDSSPFLKSLTPSSFNESLVKKRSCPGPITVSVDI
jgi:hypothetical protein